MTTLPARALRHRSSTAARSGRSTRRRLGALLPALALAAGSSSCNVLFDRSMQLSVASDPPGARVLVNASDSGFVTPSLLELDTGENVRIDLEYPGYVTATRILTPDNQVWAVLWSDMYVRSEVWHFPLWLDARNFLVPIKFDRTLSPSRLYVRLERAADG